MKNIENLYYETEEIIIKSEVISYQYALDIIFTIKICALNATNISNCCYKKLCIYHRYSMYLKCLKCYLLYVKK